MSQKKTQAYKYTLCYSHDYVLVGDVTATTGPVVLCSSISVRDWWTLQGCRVWHSECLYSSGLMSFQQNISWESLLPESGEPKWITSSGRPLSSWALPRLTYSTPTYYCVDSSSSNSNPSSSTLFFSYSETSSFNILYMSACLFHFLCFKSRVQYS